VFGKTLSQYVKFQGWVLALIILAFILRLALSASWASMASRSGACTRNPSAPADLLDCCGTHPLCDEETQGSELTLASLVYAL
jgi:hypothetical protein